MESEGDTAGVPQGLLPTLHTGLCFPRRWLSLSSRPRDLGHSF